MTRLQINIKDSKKVSIILKLLKELPFVEIEEGVAEPTDKCKPKTKGNISDLFGIWEGRPITLASIRKKAWDRS